MTIPSHVVRGPALVTEPQEIEGDRSSLLERIVEEGGVEGAPAGSRAGARAREGRIELSSGRTVQAAAEGGGDRVTVRSASGEIELEVVMTERGPLLRFRAADIALSAAGEVSVECDRFRVRAERGIVQRTGGDIELTAAGAGTVRVGEKLEMEARAVRVEAARGDVEIEANDDVKLLGERVKLNC